MFEDLLRRLCLACVALLLGQWLRRRREHFRFFQRLGIPGPKPNLLFGSLHEIYLKNALWAVNDWHRKFGPVVGLFYGKDPVLLVSDPAVLRKVFKDESDKFSSRSAIFNVPGVPNSVSCLRGDDWHRLRDKLTPLYGKDNIKKLSPVITSCIDDLVANVRRECSEGGSEREFDVSRLFEAFSLDVICRVGLGLKYPLQRQGEPHPLLRFVRDNLKPPLKLRQIFCISLPVLTSIVKRLYEFVLTWSKGSFQKRLTPIEKLRGDCVQRVQQIRASERQTSVDLLEAMLRGDAPVSETEAVDSGILNILTGYETTSSALCFITNMLIRHPNVQDRLRQELMSVVGSSADSTNTTHQQRNPEPDALANCRYLDAVIKETLRMYPPVYMFTTRISNEATELQENLRIPAGLTLMASTREMHYNEDIWPEPQRFDPDRFMSDTTEHLDDIWLPFGLGPRNCLGREFAFQVIRMTLSRLVLNYRIDTFEYLPQSRVELVAHPGLLKLKNGLRCRASPL